MGAKGRGEHAECEWTDDTGVQAAYTWRSEAAGERRKERASVCAGKRITIICGGLWLI